MDRKIRKPRISILDYHVEQIKDLLSKKVSYASAHKIINAELPGQISYTAFVSYCKNRLGL